MPSVKKWWSHNRSLDQRRWSKRSKSTKSANSSTEEEFDIQPHDDIGFIDFFDDFISNDIGDLFSFCQENINTRFISVLMYIFWRRFGDSWREIDAFLRIDGMTATSAHKWSTTLVKTDFDEFTDQESEREMRKDSIHSRITIQTYSWKQNNLLQKNVWRKKHLLQLTV